MCRPGFRNSGLEQSGLSRPLEKIKIFSDCASTSTTLKTQVYAYKITLTIISDISFFFFGHNIVSPEE